MNLGLIKITKSGRELKDLVEIKFNKVELEGSSLSEEDITMLKTLSASVKDGSYYSLTLEQMSFLLGLR